MEAVDNDNQSVGSHTHTLKDGTMELIVDTILIASREDKPVLCRLSCNDQICEKIYVT